jgi:hypothetical protein
MNITTLFSIVVVGQLGNPLVIPVAYQVPKLNVEASCKTTISVSPNMTQQEAYEVCMRDETAAQ